MRSEINRRWFWYFTTILVCISIILLKHHSNSQNTEAESTTTVSGNNETPEIDLQDYAPKTPNITAPIFVSSKLHAGTLIFMPKPDFQAHAEKSGYCEYEVQINKKGLVVSILFLNCTDDIYIKGTRKTLLESRYHPKLNEQGEKIPFTQSSKISFRLTDNEGNNVSE